MTGMTKENIRNHIRLLRKKHAAESQIEKEIKEQKIYTRLENFEPFRTAKTVLFYAAMKEEGEVETLELIKKYIQEKNILLPKIENGKMTLRKIRNTNDLTPGTFGIHEPNENTEMGEDEKIDCLIVPGVAFDNHGNRIGMGKGFYDQLLRKTRTRKSPAVALAYEFQIVQSVPVENHDEPVNFIVTEERMIDCQNQVF